ncbi:MAG: hypothetical protein EPN89_08645 [Methylovulum sp.]|nr:MAG: hypothetical protein EPN89_08645 [Methylovulum sp.]
MLKFITSSTGQAIRPIHSVHEPAKDCNKRLEADVFDEETIDLHQKLSQYNTIARALLLAMHRLMFYYQKTSTIRIDYFG